MTFSPSAAAVAFLGDSTSGFANSATARCTFSGAVVRSPEPFEPFQPRLEDVTRRQRVGESRVLRHRPRADVPAAPLTRLDVARDDLDHLGQPQQREARLDLLLERAHELLLARVSVEVRVRVPVADEVERAQAGQPLVARLEIDRGVARRAAVVVEVAAVDVHPDAPELVHELPEAAEVDRDDVVDRDTR